MIESGPLVVADRISRSYRTGPALVESLLPATCTVNPGDQIVLLGPSGSGKSTLMHVLGGLDLPTTGDVSWPALGRREELRPTRIADVFQGPSLLLPLSVIENVRLPLLLGGTGSIEATNRANEALARFEVDDLADKLPEEISGGQGQRVAIARALAVRPRLLLADEPTGQLDSTTALLVMDRLLETVRELGAALIVSTHDQRIASRFVDIWRMAGGQLTTPERTGESIAYDPPGAFPVTSAKSLWPSSAVREV